MKQKTLFLLFLLITIIYTTYSQNLNSFSAGFDNGFKKGYCYNQTVSCMPPITPIPPSPRLNESSISYTDGYHRGFQIGLDLQRIQLTNNPNSRTKEYDSYYKSIPNYQFDYVKPIDLNLLGNVLTYKQGLFNSRGNWIQQKLDNLADLNSFLYKSSNENITKNIKGQYYSDKQFDNLMNNLDSYNSANEQITILVNKLNAQALDLSDDNIFSQIKSDIKTIERLIYNFFGKAKINTHE